MTLSDNREVTRVTPGWVIPSQSETSQHSSSLRHNTTQLLPCSASQRRVEPREDRPFHYSQGRPLFLSCHEIRSWSLRSSGTVPVCSPAWVCSSEPLPGQQEDRGGG